MHCDCIKNFEYLIFVDEKLPAKAAKITFLENLYAYRYYHNRTRDVKIRLILCIYYCL